MKTVEIRFDPATLPAWARRHPAVVARCERDLAYRCDVCAAKTAQYRQMLIRAATITEARREP